MKSKLLASLLICASFFALAAPPLQAQERHGTNATVTQATSVTTGVTIEGNSGVITCFTSTQAAAGAAPVTFTVTNPAVTAKSVVLPAIVGYAGTTGTPIVRVNAIAAGTFDVIVTNTHASAALNGVYKVGFAVN